MSAAPGRDSGAAMPAPGRARDRAPLASPPHPRRRRPLGGRHRARHEDDRRDEGDPRPADHEGPGPARPERDDHLLRGLDADPRLLRGRRQEPLRRRREHRRERLVGLEGRVARRHDPHDRGAGRPHDRHAPRDLRRAVPRGRGLLGERPQRRRRLARPPDAGAPGPVHDAGPPGRPAREEGRHPRRRPPLAGGPEQRLDAHGDGRRPLDLRPDDDPARLRHVGRALGERARPGRARRLHRHVRHGRRPARRRRGHGPPAPARADGRRPAAEPARVRGPLRPDPRAADGGEAGCARHAPGADERGRRDRGRRRGPGPQRHHRAGDERGGGADGAPLPAVGRPRRRPRRARSVAESGAGAAGARGAARVGETVELLEISRAWLVDPVAGREGPGEIVVRDGILEAVTWLEGDAEADGDRAGRRRSSPRASSTCTSTSASPATRTRRRSRRARPPPPTAASRPCARCRTRRPRPTSRGSFARVRAAAAASGSPVELLLHGAVTVGRAGERLARARRARRRGRGRLLRRRLAGEERASSSATRSSTLGMLGLPLFEHVEDATLTAGAEANEGYVGVGPRPQGLAGRRRGGRRGAGDRGARRPCCPTRPARGSTSPTSRRPARSTRSAGRRPPACRSPAT